MTVKPKIVTRKANETDGEWCARQILELFGDNGVSKLARYMVAMGDHRPVDHIRRNIYNYTSGRGRVSGEITVILQMLRKPERMAAEYATARKMVWVHAEGKFMEE